MPFNFQFIQHHALDNLTRVIAVVKWKHMAGTFNTSLLYLFSIECHHCWFIVIVFSLSF